MQRPPQLPSILSASSAYSWISRVNQKFQEFSALQLSQFQQKRLRDWLEIEFLTSALQLDQIRVSRELVLRAIEAASASEPAPEMGLIQDLLARFRRLEEVISHKGQSARLSVELLLDLDAEQGFRQSNSAASTVRPEHVPGIIEQACRWFAMDSFAELNPVEQAAIALLRLSEIAPFEPHREQTSVLAASLFTRRSGLPPLIFKAAQRQDYFAALREGLRMNTQPMVELLAKSVEQTLTEQLQLLRG